MESRDGAFVRSRSAKLGSSRASRENRTAVRFAATDVDAEAGVRKPSTGLLTFIRDYSRGHLVPAHRHSCAQLLYASSGLVRVETSRRSWVLAPHLAILVPAEFTHETHMLTDVKLSSFHTEHLSQWSTRDCMVIEVTPLLRELITALTAGRPVAGSSRRLALIHELLEEELRMARGAGWAIPMPQEPRLQIFCRRVIDEPSAHATLDAVASSVGLGAKTVARLFEQGRGASGVARQYGAPVLIDGTEPLERHIAQRGGGLGERPEHRVARVTHHERGGTALERLRIGPGSR